jgi:glycosyltransferase involved in cell wall biosynthesis
LSSPLRILLIAYAVPPSAEIGGNRIAYFCKYLPEFGIDPTVLTVQDRFYKRLDHTLPPAIPVIRTVQHRTPLDWYATWKSRKGPTNSRKARTDDGRPKAQRNDRAPVQHLRQYLLSVLSIPDQYWGWYLPDTRTARQLLEYREFDAILSTSPPYTAHLIGRSLKTKYKIPWIADFRDPWVTNDPSLSSPLRWRRKLSERMEASCVRLADLVILNTDWQQKVMCERYQKLPPEKFVTLTNGFDDVAVPSDLDPNLKKRAPLHCLHLGGIDKYRRIDTFCAGLAILVKEKRLDPDALKVLFLGNTHESQITTCREVAGDLINLGMIEFRPRVDKEEAKRFLWKADLLLIFQGGYRAQIPLKFYEYLATGTPIFAVSQQGALSEIMAQTAAGVWVEEDDPSKIAEKFLHALTLPAQPREAIQRSWEQRFHFRSLSGQLAKWIRELVNAQRAEQKGAGRPIEVV